MASLNRVQLIGHLGRDPETRIANNGDKIVSLNLATSESWKDKNTGERKERTEWHRIVIFNQNLAKIAEKYIRKGSQVFIEGKLQTRKWQDRDGNDRYTTEITLTQFVGGILLLDKRNNAPPPAESAEDYGSESSYQPDQSPSTAPPPPGGDLNDDIPF